MAGIFSAERASPAPMANVLPERQAEGPGGGQLARMQAEADASPQVRQLAGITQRNSEAGGSGLPMNMQANMEAMSGVDLSGVNVHYNSAEPAKVGAHAFAQGTDIHVASGQEQHVPHEAWHVVQQAKGRVQPTSELAGGVKINDDPALEKEADAMGQKALQRVPMEEDELPG